VTPTPAARGRRRGTVGWLASGSARVKVYAGVDQLTGRVIWLRETVRARATRRETQREAERVLTKLLNQVDERRSPRTEATVSELLDRWLDVLDVERKTRAGYVSKIEKHVRPTIGRLQVGRVKGETIDGLYAQLRRCRDHCRGEKYIQHRTDGEHVCDEHGPRRRCTQVTFSDPSAYCRWCERACRQHRCTPLSASSIRVIHAILSGAFGRAVRWGWIAVSPIDATDPPPVPRLPDASISPAEPGCGSRRGRRARQNITRCASKCRRCAARVVVGGVASCHVGHRSSMVCHSAAAAASATAWSCSPSPPLTPTAPTIRPSRCSGIPPAKIMMRLSFEAAMP
jgi:hypothetical protein